MTTTEIARRLDASRTTIIHYLKILRNEGVVSYRKAGSAKLWFLLTSDKAEEGKKISQTLAQAEEVREGLDALLSEGFAMRVYNEKEVEVLRNARNILGNKRSKRT